MDQFDFVVIGSGPGGHAAAESAARLGAKTAVIEKNKWGGTCTNVGCVPTKALLACSKAYSDLKRLKRLGIDTGDPSFDFAVIKRHQLQIVRTSALGVQKSLKDKGVELISGEGHILSPSEVEITSTESKARRIQAKNIVIAWGSVPTALPGIPFSSRILNSDGFLALDRLPQSAIIVGAGNIGIEFATFLGELGCRVSLIELQDQILPCEDKEAATFLEKELRKIGVQVWTSTSLHSVSEGTDGIRMKVAPSPDGAVSEITAEYAVICTGRRPRLYEEELRHTGIDFTPRGISIDSHMTTSVENIYAVGDATGGILLAHRAARQGRALACRLFGNGEIAYVEAAVPCVTYSHPSIARVGITAADAEAHGLSVEVLRSEFGANILARAELSGTGFAKYLFHNDLLVGVTIAGEQAAELIAPLSLAMSNSMRKADLKKWVLAHPTLSEIHGIF